MGFIYLNNKSGYSFLKSTLKIEDLVNIGIKEQMPFLALTDFNNMFGVIEFVTLCNKNNIKPIIGMEIKLNDQYETPLILLASSNQGYISLCHLSKLVSYGNFENLISLEELETCKTGIICILPYIRSQMEEREYSGRVELVRKVNSIFKGFYLGLEFYKESDLTKLENARKLAENLQLDTVPVFEVLTDSAKNSYLLDVLRGIKAQQPTDNLEYIDHSNQYFMNDLKIKNIFTQKEFDSSYFVASLCDVDITKIKGELIKYPLKDNVEDFEYLHALCLKGLAKRFNNRVSQIYIDRLNYELEVIKTMGFVNYFLVVYDYVKYAKQNDIFVGPGRGSAGGSLVSYSLGITNVDPIKYDLLFERFLNPERVTMPDIDVDFIDSKREKVFEYLEEKYGKECVARIVTFSTLKARSCIRDTAKAFGCTLGEIDDLVNRLKKVKDPDATLKELVDISPAFQSLVNTNEKYRKIYDTCMKLEGLPRQTSIHAAGVIINNFDLSDVIPVYTNADGSLLTQYDMNYVESLNLLKMDLLSISDLRILDDCVKEISKVYHKNINLNEIDYSDPNIYRILQKSQTFNIFQFDKPSMTRAGSIIQPKSFDDVIVALALGRPGPSKFIRNFVDRRDGKERISYPHKILEDILKPTYGIIVYQEQIMQILVKAASFSMGKADIVRRAISKKNAVKLQEAQGDFIEGCIKNNISKEDATRIFKLIMSFAEYGFNKSHSVAYSMITLQMCYLKYYYPEVFYSVSLNIYDSKEKINDCINEMRNSGLKMKLPSVLSAEIDFCCKNNEVIYSLSRIKGLNNVFANSIIEERNKEIFKDYVDAVTRLHARGLGKDEIVALIEAGSFDEFKYNRQTMLSNLDRVLMYADIITRINLDGTYELDKEAAGLPIINEINDNNLENLKKEKARLGAYVSGFPLESHRLRIKNKGFVTINSVDSSNKDYKIVALIEDFRDFRTKKNDWMASCTLVDETGSISLTVFPEKYDLYKSILKRGNYIQLIAYSDERDDQMQLIAHRIKIYPMDEEGENK